MKLDYLDLATAGASGKSLKKCKLRIFADMMRNNTVNFLDKAESLSYSDSIIA